MRRLQHIILPLLFVGASCQLLAQSTTLGGSDLHFNAIPFGPGVAGAPLDMLLDGNGYVWLVDERGVVCMLSHGPHRVLELPKGTEALRWARDSKQLMVETTEGQLDVGSSRIGSGSEGFIYPDANSLRELKLPEGQTALLTDSGKLVLSSAGETQVIPLVSDKHTYRFELELGDHGRMLYDPNNGIWILGSNGLMLASHRTPIFRTRESRIPLGKITQVVEDARLDRRFIYSISRGLLVEELSTGDQVNYFRTDKDGKRIGGTKWHQVNGKHYFYGKYRLYTYDPVNDEVVVVLDLSEDYEGSVLQLTINDVASHPVTGWFYLGTDDNRLYIHDPSSGRTVEHFVKEKETFSGINLILETAPFGKDEAVIVAEHGHFIMRGMDGPLVPAHEVWPNFQFGPNFRGAGGQVLGDTLVIAPSFTDGVFLYSITRDALFRPEGMPESEELFTDIFWDGDHTVYGTTRTGLMIYDVSDNTISRITTRHGLPLHNLYYRYLNRVAPGEMVLGLTDRYTRFTTEALKRSSTDDLFIEVLEVNGNPLMADTKQPVGERLELNHLQNNIGLRLGVSPRSSKPLSNFFIMLNDQQEQVSYHDDRSWVRFNALSTGTHEMKIAFSKDGPYQDLITLVIAPAFWKTWWFMLLVVLLVFGVGLLMFRWRLSHVRHEAQMKAEFDSRVAQLELNALRAQMHPHFIFNSLNSIKSFIADNEPRSATRYLNKFSQLIRAILNNSRHERVDLRSEVKALQLYIELEQMRFTKQFDARINVADDIDQEEVGIPPMIFQPFAENAIWHGFMQKDGPCELTVDIVREGKMLVATIRDNGIGRAASAKLKSATETKHRSLGMKITSELIERTHTGGQKGVVINDLHDEEGNASGTEVIVYIPIEHSA